jgi:hypothetical protein
MAATNENYTTARTALVPAVPRVDLALNGERLEAGSRSTAIAWDFRHWVWAGDATAVSAGGLRWYFVLPD